ncbi:DUF2298 domain-containing protein [Microbacterium sp. No. 7]|uniref:DUF2298 domain-containing protein n=1 Tax=Microbacterium sp. No. 7 TaxID=1714373 RepID=UPI0006D17DD2|nr:DUF2298 domain-containing protein [Microbacterium sp. No. 7]ALJ18957.1 hypothetical protein AOA12_03160 [Microbacterium sp. No. 7]
MTSPAPSREPRAETSPAEGTATSPSTDSAATSRVVPRGGVSPVLVAVVLVAALAVASLLLLQGDGWLWGVWLFTLALPGAAVWPLAVRLFHRTPAVVLPFALALGGLLVGLAVWTLASLRILPFQSWAIWLVLAALAAACWGPPGLRAGVRDLRGDRHALVGATLFAALFVVALGAWSYVRGMNPAIDGLEKFMDFGFMMSLVRSDALPAADPWLAGHDINYYYFGQFFYTLFVKLSLVPPAVGYNLAVASTVAYALTLAAAIGWQLSAWRRPGRARRHALTALATAFFVGVAGNAHSFFYATNGPGRGLIEAGSAAGLPLGSTADWFYPRSTRYIGYNPETTDKTIHEFPSYSFLVGDLHAHLVNTLFVLLFIGLVIQHVATRSTQATTDAVDPGAPVAARLRGAAQALVRTPLPLFGALALAVFLMGNYWDLVIYYVVLAGVVLVAAIGARPRPTASALGLFAVQQLCVLVPFAVIGDVVLATVVMLAGSGLAAFCLRVRDERLTRDGAGVAFAFALAHLVALPFGLGFDPISRSIAFAQAHTPVSQLLVVWGPQLLILLGGAIAFVAARPFVRDRPASDWIVVALGLCAVGLIAVPEVVYVVDIYENGFARANTMFKLTYQASILLGIVMPYVLAGAALRAWDAWRERRAAAASGAAADADGAAGDGGGAAADGGGAAVDGGRAAGGRAVVRTTVLVLGLAAAVAPAWYPLAALPQVIPTLRPADYRGYDGAAWMARSAPGTTLIGGQQHNEALADDAAAIAWLNAEVDGQPHIVEAAGVSYTHLSRISSFTGLPTVLGWDTHEWLWRTSASQPDAYGAVVAPRTREIKEFYTQPDVYAADFLQRYDVTYVIVGELERSRYPDMDPARIEALGEVVFRSGTTAVVRVG